MLRRLNRALGRSLPARSSPIAATSACEDGDDHDDFGHGPAHNSAENPASLRIGFQYASSEATFADSCGGVELAALMPSCANDCATSTLSSAFATEVAQCSTRDAGVPLGMKNPNHSRRSIDLKPCSMNVETSVNAMTRSRRDSTCGRKFPSGPIADAICPASTSCVAGPVPR